MVRVMWFRLICGAACAAALTCFSGCREATTAAEVAPTTKAEVPQVSVSAAGQQTWPETVRVQGTLLPHEQSVVGAKVAGRIASVAVDLGMAVKAGEVMVALDDRDYALRVEQARAQLAQACAAVGITPEDSELTLNRENAPPVLIERAALEEARASYDRAVQLESRRAITDDELKRLEAQFKAATARLASSLNNVGQQIATISVRRAELALAKQQLSDTQIVAPFDGVVERRQVDPGEHVQIGAAVITLVRADTLRFAGGVPERRSHLVKQGQQIQIHLESESEPINVTVTRVSPALTQSGRSLLIEADVPNPDLKRNAGLFAEADIVVDATTTALTVPESAIMEFAGIEKVWRVRDSEAAEQPVRTGRRRDGLVEILGGLQAGDLVVTNSGEGQPGKVAIIQRSSGEQSTANGVDSHSLPVSE